MRTYDVQKSSNEVRQGSRRLMNLRVLITSSIAVVLVFGLLLGVYYWLQPVAA